MAINSFSISSLSLSLMLKIGQANGIEESFQIIACRMDEMKGLVLIHFYLNKLKINTVCRR